VNRRQWSLIIASGIVAAGLGVFLALNHNTSKAGDLAVENLLKTELRSPAGEVYKTNEWRQKVLIINFWAPWCPPCVEEMPTLKKIQAAYKTKNVLFLGIGVDSPSNIREFLKKTPVDYPIILGGLEGGDWAKNLGNPSGGLPFTVLIDEKGTIKKTKLGKISEDELISWLEGVILTSK
jgi:thiol-disulfide isomerase/thioredoxin